MASRFHSFVAVVLFASVASAALVAQQPQRMTAAEIASITAEVKKASDKYFKDFSDHKMETLDESYNVPLITLGGNGVTIRSTRDDVIKRAVDSYNQYLPEKTGYLRSEMPNPNICVVNSGTAIVSGNWYRIKKDGSQMSESGIVYFWTKTPAGWRMLGWAGASTTLAITCKQ
jgi:hypothetical protein